MRSSPRLSKSRVQYGLQCQRRLWLETYRRDLIDIDQGQQMVFDDGNDLGELARRLYGPGVLIEHAEDIRKAIAETSVLLAQAGKRPRLFEPAFRHKNVVVRADVLKPVAGGYDLIEVKGSASVKINYIDDCATQAWVIQNAGLRLKRIYLAHVDGSFVYKGDGNYRGLLHAEDVTDAVRARIPQVSTRVNVFTKALRGDEPDIKTGAHCDKPYRCPFFAHCRSQEPPPAKFPVEILPHGRSLIKELIADGYADLRKVPAKRLDKPLHQRVRKASVTGKSFLDPAASKRLSKLGYPRYFLDFETTRFTIPIWKVTRPFQQIPFQWSCHIEQRDGSIEHLAFLDLGGELPIRKFVKTLLAAIGTKGPIFVYHQPFEETRLRELAAMLPNNAKALRALIRRMIDLLPITRKHYYHPAMMGSWSIKKVLPTIAPELSYEHLDEVADGESVQWAYREATHPDTPSDRRSEIDIALRRYCANDTLALVKLVEALAG